MISPQHQPYQMRYDQPDKTDQPGGGDAGADAQRGQQHQLPLDPLDIYSQMTGLGLTQ